METTYQVINIRTGELVATRKTRKPAQRLADKLDLEYGAINYTVRVATPSEQYRYDLSKFYRSLH